MVESFDDTLPQLHLESGLLCHSMWEAAPTLTPDSTTYCGGRRTGLLRVKTPMVLAMTGHLPFRRLYLNSEKAFHDVNKARNSYGKPGLAVPTQSYVRCRYRIFARRRETLSFGPAFVRRYLNTYTK